MLTQIASSFRVLAKKHDWLHARGPLFRLLVYLRHEAAREKQKTEKEACAIVMREEAARVVGDQAATADEEAGVVVGETRFS
jgi:cyanophycinase-like exopeptidase